MVVLSKIKTEECSSSTSLLKRPVPRKANHVFAKAKVKTEPAGEEEPNTKRMRHMSLDHCHMGEIVVIVGGKTFHEDSQTFASSELIQSAVQVGKREFHFNKVQDPSEWDLVKQLLDPFSDTRICKENLSKADLVQDPQNCQRHGPMRSLSCEQSRNCDSTFEEV